MKPPLVLLIGIDYYPANPCCGSLYGAVADVEAMHSYLIGRGVPSSHIRCLLSPHAEDDAPADAPRLQGDGLPTRRAIVEAISDLGQRAAQEGTRIFIHYSGHGGRAKTWLPRVKGSEGFDEGLLTCDLDGETPGFLRDVELTWLFDSITRNGVAITVVWDACHSGGLVRSNSSRVRRRSAHSPLGGPSSGDSLGGSPASATLLELEQTWLRVHRQKFSTIETPSVRRGSTRGFLGGQGILVIAACHSTRFAFERDFGRGPRGTLTHCLLEGLKTSGPEQSMEELYQGLTQRMRSLSPPQHPMFEGDRPGDVPGMLTLPSPSPTGPSKSDAWPPIAPFGVVLVEESPVSVAPQGPLMRNGRRRKPPIELLDSALAGRQIQGLRWSRDRSTICDFRVLCGLGGFTIQWTDGRPVPHIPDGGMTLSDRAQHCALQLEHLAYFMTLRDLEAPVDSDLNDALSLDLDTGPGPIAPGVETQLHISNHSRYALYLLVCDLGADWSVGVLYPKRGVASLEHRQRLSLPFTPSLPPGHGFGVQTLRVIATLEPMIIRGWSPGSLAEGEKPSKTLRTRRIRRRSNLRRSGSPKDFKKILGLGPMGPTLRRGSREPSWPRWATAHLDLEVCNSVQPQGTEPAR